jgi:predicted amidohydrolase YtcJ
MIRKATLLAAAFGASAVMAPLMARAAGPMAEAVYRNGRIYTLDPNSSIISAVAVMDGKFLAVGGEADVEPFIGPQTQVIDLGGKPVIPGLNDTHDHTMQAGEAAVRVKLDDVKSVAEALQRIKDATTKKKPGEWIIGDSWHPTAQLKEECYLTAAEIDTVAPNNPVQVGDGHISSYNTAAMKIGGVDRNTPNPEGGVIDKDASGNPNGIFEEKAIGLISLHIPPPTVAEMEERFVNAMKVANAYGLTSVTNPGLNPKQVRALQRLMLAHKLTLRYSAMYNPPQIMSAEKWDEETNANGASSGFGNEWLKFDAIGEMTSDGGMTLRTAFTRDPYPDDPNYHGIPATTKERLISNVLIGNRNDWRFSIHSVGDAAIDWVLDAYEAADKDKSIAGRRFACMHCSLIRKDQLERMKRLGVILELQNAFMWDKADNVERNLGLAVANRAVPNRMAIDILGINNVSMGTDYQTNSMDPWINLYIAVTRKDPRGKVYGADQAITREEALRLYTISGAYSSFDEKVKGPIEVGKLADMVVLDRDYFTIPAEQIKDVKPLQTIVGGAVVYRR